MSEWEYHTDTDAAVEACARFLRMGCKVTYYCRTEVEGAEFMARITSRYPKEVIEGVRLNVYPIEEDMMREGKSAVEFLRDQSMEEDEDEDEDEWRDEEEYETLEDGEEWDEDEDDEEGEL